MENKIILLVEDTWKARVTAVAVELGTPRAGGFTLPTAEFGIYLTPIHFRVG
jgi:hypothetical protein